MGLIYLDVLVPIDTPFFFSNIILTIAHMEETQNLDTLSVADQVSTLQKEIDYLTDCMDALNKSYATLSWIIKMHKERIEELTEQED